MTDEVRDADAPTTIATAPPRVERPKQFKRDKRDVHGWVVLDKPVGMTSTHAVSIVKRLFTAKRAGHAGTLDPLASGALPIALGEATKTVPFVMDGRKLYQFTVRWGEERDTDDAEGRVTANSDARPAPQAIRALLPSFTGAIEQVPPKYSAIKIDGERAYDLARDGATVELAAGTYRHPRSRSRGSARRMRQRDLCPFAGPRHGPRFGLFRPCQRAPAGRGWAVWRRNHDFTGTIGGPVP
jgi:tRNA pseudouridine55 synthase